MRRCTPLIALALLTMSVPLLAQEGTGATVDKTGWWNEANVGIDTPAGIQDVPAPPNIPENGIAVSVTAGQNDKIAAVGIRPNAEEGDAVTTFTMTVDEVSDGGANANAGGDDTQIVACPITDFWGQTRNGRQSDKPPFDCEAASAEGKRKDGTWTFDLTAIGAVWLDPFETISPDGVALVAGPDAGDAFQVVFDVTTIAVTFEFTEGTSDEPDSFEVPEPVDSGGTGDFGAASGQVGTFNPPSPISTPSASPSFGGDSGGSGTVDLGTVDIPEASDDPVATPDPVDDSGSTPTEVAGTPVSTADNGFLGGLPGGSFVLFFFFLALIYAMSFALGPLGDPATTVHRQRGVSRALAARERAAAQSLERQPS